MSKVGKLLLATVVALGPARALAEHGKVGAWHLDTQTKVADPHGDLIANIR